MSRNVQSMMAAAAEVEAFATAAAIAFLQFVVEINNEGGGGAPPAPIDKGELRGSPRVTLNSPSSEGPDEAPFGLVTHADVARSIQLQGFSLADVIFLTWVAEHAAVIDAGRKVGSDGVLRGSLQAPQGWVAQDADVAAGMMAGWVYDPTGVGQ